MNSVFLFPMRRWFGVAAALWLVSTAFCSAQPLVFDAVQKNYSAKVGETNAHLSFSVTNVSNADVTINAVRTSCGCTVAKLPSLPWKLTPGTNGEVQVTVDLRGKRGSITKTVTVDSTAGVKLLTVNINIPEAPAPATTTIAGNMNDRTRNQMSALADRQAVFKGECASCHADKTVGKKGPELFVAACGICHEAEHRASMVPDLNALTTAASREYWFAWITRGKIGTLMPGFAKGEGGPLSREQVDSLVDYLSTRYAMRTAAGRPQGNPVR
jgi:mono/diheme cytochrome c family protein